MRHLKSFKLFENVNNSVDIETFLSNIGIPFSKIPKIVEWWNKNRSHIRIYHFPFSSRDPIFGVILSENEVALNSKIYAPPHMKLFVILHESAHCDQHREGRFMPLYFDTVVQGNKREFLSNYMMLEVEANNFAINSMREIGFSEEMNREERRLRGNEGAGSIVYDMMKRDIEKFRPVDFIELLKKQVY